MESNVNRYIGLKDAKTIYLRPHAVNRLLPTSTLRIRNRFLLLFSHLFSYRRDRQFHYFVKDDRYQRFCYLAHRCATTLQYLASYITDVLKL